MSAFNKCFQDQRPNEVGKDRIICVVEILLLFSPSRVEMKASVERGWASAIAGLTWLLCPSGSNLKKPGISRIMISA